MLPNSAGPLPTDEIVRARLSSIGQATAILNTHVPTDAGVCGGCLEVWGRWVPATGCTQLAWARSVVETHGVGDDAWEVPVIRSYADAIAG